MRCHAPKSPVRMICILSLPSVFINRSEVGSYNAPFSTAKLTIDTRGRWTCFMGLALSSSYLGVAFVTRSQLFRRRS